RPMLVQGDRGNEVFRTEVTGLVTELAYLVEQYQVADAGQVEIIGQQLPQRARQATAELCHRWGTSDRIRGRQDAQAAHQRAPFLSARQVRISQGGGSQAAGGDRLISTATLELGHG